VTVAAVRDTQLIEVDVEDASPDRAARLANEIVTQFQRQNEAIETDRYNTSRRLLQQEMDTIQADLARLSDQIAALAGRSDAEATAKRTALQSSETQARASYTNLVSSLEEMRVTAARRLTNIVVVEPARPPPIPIRPRPLLEILLGAAAGLVLALGFAFLREYLDDTVKDPAAVERALAAPFLGGIGTVPGANEQARLIAQTLTQAPLAEADRVIAANLEFADLDQAVQTILVSSAGPGEGKTLSVANVAVALAQLGKRVICVDADLRKPTLHKYFGQPNTRGLTSALLAPAGAAATYLLPTESENLRLLPSGPLPPNAPRLLGSQRMHELIAELQAQADLVLIDSPPALMVADATLIARHVDAVMLVVVAGVTRLDTLPRTSAALTQSGTRLLGFVINRAGTDQGLYHYRYYTGADPTPRAWWRRKRPAQPASDT
jgi:non-specific protein-tyrosine kinase